MDKCNIMNFLKKHSTVIIIAVCIIAEIIISNYSALSILFGGYNEKDLSLETAQIENNNSTEFKDDLLYISEGTIIFNDINEPVANVCIHTASSDSQYKKIELSLTDDNFAYSDGFEYNHGIFYIYENEEHDSYLSYSSFGETKSLCIDVDKNSKGKLAVRSVCINKPRPFHINLLRLIIFLGIGFIVKFGLWKYTVENNKYSRRILAGTVAAVCFITCVCAIMLTKTPGTRLLSDYDPENMYSEDQYEKLFYAFSQGRVSIDVDFDISEFDQLDNIYDRSERNEKDIHGAFWDRAYYNGKFYCYFGAAPVITVYYPVYILTHHVPTPVLASMILAVYAEIFISLLYIKIIKKMCSDVPIVLALMGLLAVLSGSLVLPLAFELQFYYMAVLSGVGAVSAYLYFLLSAYYTQKQKHRIIYLILSGVSAVIIVASRPTLVLYCFIAIVPAVFIFLDKNIRKKLKVYYSAAIITPVIVGAILIMIYNYVRFENPFEFGFNYQLTVSIAKANTITFAMIPAAIYHFFFQQPDFSTHFPYFHMRSRTLELYPRYNYNGRLIGVFYYPLTWGFMLIPFTDRKKDKFKHTFSVSLAGFAIVLAFVDMCKAGAHYRYTADILMPLLMVGIIVVFDILNRLKAVSEKLYKRAYIMTAVIFFLTFVVGFLMMFCNETENLMNTYAHMSRIFYKG